VSVKVEEREEGKAGKERCEGGCRWDQDGYQNVGEDNEDVAMSWMPCV
jgi:hypothetical protein